MVAIVDMYDLDRMGIEFPIVRKALDTPKELLHDRNNEVLERSYIGDCSKNDTECLEKIFELSTK